MKDGGILPNSIYYKYSLIEASLNRGVLDSLYLRNVFAEHNVIALILKINTEQIFILS
jgi:hypothetical protein